MQCIILSLNSYIDNTFRPLYIVTNLLTIQHTMHPDALYIQCMHGLRLFTSYIKLLLNMHRTRVNYMHMCDAAHVSVPCIDRPTLHAISKWF